MIRKRYYSPFENDEIVQPQRITEENEQSPRSHAPPVRRFKCANLPNKRRHTPLSFLSELKTDDLILIGLILLLLFEEKEERDMPLILGLFILPDNRFY